MDYMLNPLICTIWCAQQAHAFAPGVPVWGWKIFFAVVFTLLNIRGVKTSARINTGMAVFMGAVIAVIFVTAIRYIFGHPHDSAGFFTRPFYDPPTFNYKALFGCTSIAVLTYIGFDGISTLSEEAENPRRNILIATVLTCVVIGLLSAVEVYIAQLIWPASEHFPNVGYRVRLCGRARMGAAVLHCGRHAAAREFRLGHGRANRRGAAAVRHGPEQRAAEVVFWRGRPEASRATEQCVLRRRDRAGRLLLSSYGRGAEMLNFGALIAFMGVNAAAFVALFRARGREENLEPACRRCWDL